MKWRSPVCLIWAVMAGSCVCGASEAGPATEFAFPRGQYPLFVPVQLGARACDFLLDTGCTGTILDLSFRTQLGEPKGKHRASTLQGKSVGVQVFAPPSACVGPFNLADCNEVLCLDLNRQFGKFLGRQMHGILGMSFLRKHVVQIDFEEGRIRFLDDSPGDRQNWGQEFAVTYNRMKMPQIKLAVGGQPEQDFMVDTGCDTSGALAKDCFRRAIRKERLRAVNTAMITAAGVVRSRCVRVGKVTLGPFEYRDVIFSEARDNLLGMDFLSRHVVTFDFPRDRMYLRKGRDFDKQDEAGMGGLSLEYSEGRMIVSGVSQRGPAAKAGIRAGDIILELDGRNASTYERWEVRDLLRSGHGRQIAMTVRRDDRTRNVVVVLERRL